MGIVLSTQCGSDYHTPCGNLSPSFIQMLASCLYRYTCGQNVGQVRINFLCAFDGCDHLSAYWTCANQGVTPEQAERALVEEAFALDECGNLGVKAFINLGEPIQ